MDEDTIINFNYNNEQIQKPLSTKIYMQGVNMNSKNFNDTMESLEETLNTLYEKTRYLEESIEYANNFLNQRIEEYRAQINKNLSIIDNMKNVNKNLGYIDIPVLLKDNIDTIPDRIDTYKLYPCVLNENKTVLMQSDRDNLIRQIESCEIKSTSTPYDNNIDELKENKKYRSLYLEDKVQEKGITEQIYTYFSKAEEVNKISTKPVNCKLSGLELIYMNGLKETMDVSMGGINTNSRILDGFIASITCKTYDIVQYEFDKNSYNADTIWNNIKDYEYALTLDDSSQIKMDALIRRTITHTSTGVTETQGYREFSGETITVTKYLYVFGLDEFEASLTNLNNNAYFLSDNIQIGDLSSSDYIELEVNDNTGEYSSIEYYIVDGAKDIPILPIGTNVINNERLFPEKKLRFDVDYSDTSIGIFKIKKDGVTVEENYASVADKYDSVYSASYIPEKETSYKYHPMSDTIKIKAIVRQFGDTYDTIPYIKNINIKKFGGNTLWTNIY